MRSPELGDKVISTGAAESGQARVSKLAPSDRAAVAAICRVLVNAVAEPSS